MTSDQIISFQFTVWTLSKLGNIIWADYAFKSYMEYWCLACIDYSV